MQTTPVVIQGDGYNLSGTLVGPDYTSRELPAVVFYHGMVSKSKPRYVKRAQALTQQGIVGLCFDFRGCGKSDGKLGEISMAQWLEDALLAFDYLLQQPFVDKDRIGVSGKSFGGYMAALVSEKRKVKSIVLQAPAVYPDEWFDKPYTVTGDVAKQRLEYRKSSNALNNKAISAIKQYNNPLLVIGSELDDICPKQVVEGYYDSCPSSNKKLRWIKSADHALRNKKHNEEYTKIMVKWFKQTL